jgi:hypothetical protein
MPTKTTALSVMLAIAVVLTGCASQRELEPEPAKYARSSPEYQLAEIDKHGGQPTNSEVERYVAVLNELRGRCTDSRRQLTEWASDIKANFTSDSEMHLLEMAVEQVDRVDVQLGPGRHGSCKEIFLVVGVAAKEGVSQAGKTGHSSIPDGPVTGPNGEVISHAEVQREVDKTEAEAHATEAKQARERKAQGVREQQAQEEGPAVEQQEREAKQQREADGVVGGG